MNGNRFCTNCGAGLKEGVAFCTECGAHVGSVHSPTTPPAQPDSKPMPPRTAGVGQEWMNTIDGSTMNFVPAGNFTMGSRKQDVEKFFMKYRLPMDRINDFYDEIPAVEVFVSDFWISKYTITHAQFGNFLKATAKLTNPELSTELRNYYGRFLQPTYYPVPLTWFEALEYCRWAGMDLPTEAEWEKAARGTDRRIFPWGNDVRLEFMNTYETSNPFVDGIEVNKHEEAPSPYGCVQMAGNVTEWCADWYDPQYYQNIEKRDPRGPRQGSFKVLRGGDTNKVMVQARTTARQYGTPDKRLEFCGFRPVIRLA